LLEVDNPDFNLTALDFSPDEKALVSTSSIDPEVRVWDLAQKRYAAGAFRRFGRSL